MKRIVAAGTLSLAAGLFSLVLFASIVYSCREGGHPHANLDASQMSPTATFVGTADVPAPDSSEGVVVHRTVQRVAPPPSR